MIRHTAAFRINAEKRSDFYAGTEACMAELTVFLDEKGVRNFSIWNADAWVFVYGETGAVSENEETVCVEEAAKGMGRNRLSEEERVRLKKILAPVEGCITWLSAPGEQMRLMYHDIGIVREDKENIRHRMFMTKLKDGCAEEYKRRHDALVAARGESIDPGPDSNFTIWSDGQYIFGYDEIDTTMETEPTEEKMLADLAWETRQLEIMDWITNDCDRMFGTHHAACACLASHN